MYHNYLFLTKVSVNGKRIRVSGNSRMDVSIYKGQKEIEEQSLFTA